MITSNILANDAEISYKAQQVIESNEHIKKMFNETTIAYLEYENNAKKVEILQEQLKVSKNEAETKRIEAEIKSQEHQLKKDYYEFDKKRQKFQDQATQEGLVLQLDLEYRLDSFHVHLTYQKLQQPQ